MRSLPAKPSLDEASSQLYWGHILYTYGISPKDLVPLGAVAGRHSMTLDLTTHANVSAAVDALVVYCVKADPNYPHR